MRHIALIMAVSVMAIGLGIGVTFSHDEPVAVAQYNPCPGGKCPPR